MDPVQTLEYELAALSEELTAPTAGECLACYLERMLGQHGCTNDHRFTRRWAQSRRRGTPDGLVRWAQGRGGCCCDCEVVYNSLSGSGARRRGGTLCDAALARLAAQEDDPAAVGCSGVPG